MKVEKDEKNPYGYLNYPLSLKSGILRDSQYFEDLLENKSTNGRELTLHTSIPFCDSICTFCGGARRLVKTRDVVEKYLQALKAEAEIYSKTRYISSSIFSAAYFGGGGTPTLLSSEELCSLLSHYRNCFTFSKNVEITVESTTHNLTEDKLVSLLGYGVKRIYLGVQTFNDALRKLFNRTENSKVVIQRIKNTHEFGYDVHIDLMYNLPGQSVEMWKEELENAIDLNIESISIFRLHLYPHLKLAKMLQSGEIPSIKGENIAKEMNIEAVETMTEAGYKQQYASGFVLPGKELRHFDHVYKYDRERLGLGTTNWFCSLLGKYLYRNFESLERYAESIRNGKFPIAEGVRLSKEDEMRRVMIRGLNSSVDKNAFKKRFGRMPEDVFPKAINCLRKQGLIINDEQEIKLTDLATTLAYSEATRCYREFLSKNIKTQKGGTNVQSAG